VTEIKGTAVNTELRGSLVNVEKVSVDATGLGKQAVRIVDAFARFGFPRRYIEAQRAKALAGKEGAIIRAEGEAEARRIQARAAVDEAAILEDGARGLYARMIQRLGEREFHRQLNLESIEYKAVESAPDSGSDEPVSDDFMAHFIEQSQDSSEEWLKDFWARILIGEFEGPGSFSPRTLHAVKMMRRQDAELFKNYCRFVWISGHDGPSFVVIADANDRFWSADRKIELRQVFQREGLTSLRRMHLQALNLITLNDPDMALNIRSPMGLPTQVAYHGQPYWFRRSDNERVQLPVDFLTDIGRELSTIAGAEPHAEYEHLVLEQVRELGFEVSTTY
jgi:hypothetical protein